MAVEMAIVEEVLDKPVATPPQLDTIPSELKSVRQWVAWDFDPTGDAIKPYTKVLKNPHTGHNASVSNPNTWGMFEEAVGAYGRYQFTGIGFVFTAEDEYVGIDLDKSYNPQTHEFTPFARSIINECNSYTEFSASGKGVHVIVKGTIPGPRRRNDRMRFEVYEQARWFAWTGNLVPGAPSVISGAQAVLEAVYTQVFGAPGTADNPRFIADPESSPTLDDDEVLRLVRKSKNGPRFEALWNNEEDANGGFSGGDLSLCGSLAFWCSDEQQIDRLFRQSGRMRPKWDEHRGRATYGDMTISKAVANQTSHYEPEQLVKLITRVRAEEVENRADDAEPVEDGTTMFGIPESKSTDLFDAAETWAELYQTDWVWDMERKVWLSWGGEYWIEEPHRPSSPNVKLLRMARRVLRLAGLDVTGSARVDELIRQAAASMGKHFTQQEHLVNFKNGTLEIQGLKLREHRREDGLTYIIPFDYTAAPFPTIERFLSETIDEPEGIEALKTHIGLAVLRDILCHRFILLLGPPRSGKSTLLQLANLAVGQDPKSDAGHQIFSTDVEGLRSRATWGSKRLVTLEELPGDSLRSEEMVKKMTAHGGADKRALFVMEDTINIWRPKLMAATNTAPRYADHSGALTERLVVIPCPHHRTGDQLNLLLIHEMQPEVPGFTFACVQSALSCLANHGQYPMSDNMRWTLKEIATRGDALKAFVEDFCTMDPDAWTPVDALYAKYRLVSEDAGTKCLSKDRFSASLVEGHSDKLNNRERRRVKGAGQVRGIRGLKLATRPVMEGE